MFISTTTLTSSPSDLTAVGQKQEACSSIGLLARQPPLDRPLTTPSSATLSLAIRQPNWSEADTPLRPFGRSHQFRYIPRPDLVGGLGQQLGLLVDRMAELVTAFADLAVFGQDAIHGADRAKIDALVQQGGIDLGRGQVDEPGCAQKIEQ